MQSEAPTWLWFLIPALFVLFGGGLWLGVTTLLGALSGWRAIERRYPDRPEPALEQLRGQSGRMGVGVNFNRCLRLDICTSGLRVAVPRILGPFSRPFLVPWSEIAANREKVLFGMLVRLTFGQGTGHLDLRPATCERIAALTPLRIA